MNFLSFVVFLAISHTVSAHYVFQTLIAGDKTSSKAVRVPAENGPVAGIDSQEMRCNANTSPATETIEVAAGSKVGFKLGGNTKIFHMGPAAIYLGKAPGTAAQWDGSGKSWFKLKDFGATFNPFSFESLDKSELTATIPPQVPAGEYLVRLEQAGLHLTGQPEFYVSCAQIKVTNGGNGNPETVAIPGHVSLQEPGLSIDIYYPVPTSYTPPGPEPYYGQ